ncbi:MAG: hypothetical protein GY861_08035 [bacterium]|nr:hypothetical protein [bacterium]
MSDFSKHPTYLEGLIECEAYHKEHKSLAELEIFVDIETSIVDNDHRWNNWSDGMKDYLEFAKENGL